MENLNSDELQNSEKEIEITEEMLTDELEIFLLDNSITFSVDIIDSLFLTLYSYEQEYNYDEFKDYILDFFPEDILDDDKKIVFQKLLNNHAVIMKEDFASNSDFYKESNEMRNVLLQLYNISFEIANIAYFVYSQINNENIHEQYFSACNIQRRVISATETINLPDEHDIINFRKGVVKIDCEYIATDLHTIKCLLERLVSKVEDERIAEFKSDILDSIKELDVISIIDMVKS